MSKPDFAGEMGEKMIDWTRRDFLRKGLAGAGLAGLLVINAGFSATPMDPKEQVSPAEDLMREHGLLERLLLIYEESSYRLTHQGDLPPDVLASAARINRNFVENYHEKLEENYLFPLLKKAGQQVELVNILLTQHQAGRHLTDTILRYATWSTFKNVDERQALVTALNQYIRMSRPHAAREDTVLFPAFKAVVSEHEYDALGERFEDEEHRLFGKAGFEDVVGEIAELENQLGLYELNQFTPAEKRTNS